MENRNKSAKIVTLGGILLALSVITVFLASFIPGVELTLYAVSSFYIAVIIIETSKKGGWMFYISSCILLFFLIPNKMAIVPYVFFFGIYGIVKLYIEKIKNQPLEIILKLLFFNLCWGLVYYLFRQLFTSQIELPDLPTVVIVGGAQLMFLLYDYIYTMAIGFYHTRFPKM